jgi:hypothetical protein
VAIGAFSRLAPGPLSEESGWVHQPLEDVPPNRADIVVSGTMPVLRIASQASASAWSHPVVGGLRRARRLQWRWAVSGTPGKSELGRKSADDFGARLYVVFDYPLDKVPWTSRLGIRVARALYGSEVPAAALCYVWHPPTPPDTLVDSPYTSRVKMIVPGGEGGFEAWRDVERDVAKDFERAFGEEYGPGVAPIKAIIVSADTDQTGGEVNAFFGDIRLSDLPA